MVNGRVDYRVGWTPLTAGPAAQPLALRTAAIFGSAPVLHPPGIELPLRTAPQCRPGALLPDCQSVAGAGAWYWLLRPGFPAIRLPGRASGDACDGKSRRSGVPRPGSSAPGAGPVNGGQE